MAGILDYSQMVNALRGGLLGNQLAPQGGNSLLQSVAMKNKPLDKGLNPANTLEGAKPYYGGSNATLYHGSPTLQRGADWNPNMSSAAPRTDPGYLGRGMYSTPQEWIAKAYAKPPKGGSGQGYVIKGQVNPKAKMLDVRYDDKYVANIEAAAKKLGLNDKFMSPGWAEKFAAAAKKAGYDGARGLNSDGSVAEVVIYNPAKMMKFD
jgi:hypothetical protein